MEQIKIINKQNEIINNISGRIPKINNPINGSSSSLSTTLSYTMPSAYSNNKGKCVNSTSFLLVK